ncbi:stage II sporulation protein M [Verrucomicrobiota bacterium]
MIVDLERFITTERPHWEELESVLDRVEAKTGAPMSMEELRRFHYLYERTSADLSKLNAFASEREVRGYLESLVARAYGEIHETREKPHRLRPIRWMFGTFPRTFRRHIRAFETAVAMTLLGCLFGGLVIGLDASSREVLLPFGHGLNRPSDRVAQEEKDTPYDRLHGRKARGAAFYITHNTRVSIVTMAAGVTWGIGTILLLLANGVMMGAIVVDYVAAGETEFLIGWLLPHGSVEIPAILLAGQAGLVLAGALIGRGTRVPLRTRLREISPDVVTLMFGVVVFLVWAGIVEAFVSQYHEPTIPYWFKTTFGAMELGLVILLLARCGREKTRPAPPAPATGNHSP